MIEIGRIFTFGITNNRDIVRRLMGTSEFFKGLTFSSALAAYRYAETNGLVRRTSEYIVVFHDAN